jgi:hypothetical protein
MKKIVSNTVTCHDCVLSRYLQEMNIKGMLVTTKLLDFVHRPDCYKQKIQRFGNWIVSVFRRGGDLLYRKPKSLPFHRKCQNNLASPVERQAFGFSVE